MGRRVTLRLVSALVFVLAFPTMSSARGLSQSDLEISLAAAPSTVVGGSEVAFTATITNPEARDADDVVVTDTLPPGAIFVPGGSSASCSLGEPINKVICDVGKVPHGSSAEVVIVAVMPCVSAILVDTAEVGDDDAGVGPSDDGASATVTVETPCLGASQEVVDGGMVTTDPDRTGTDPGLGVFETTALVVPQGVSGLVSIQLTTGPLLDACPGFAALVATTSQPTSDEQHRTVLTFTYAYCSIPSGSIIRQTTN